MKRSIRVRVVHHFLAMTVVLAALATATQAQTFSTEISPFVGFGRLTGVTVVAPFNGDPPRSISLDASRFVGLAAEFTSSRVPIALRVSLSRTQGGRLRVQTGQETSSCGASCTSTKLLFGSAGGASVAMGWVDVRLNVRVPYLSPYVFIGVERRRTSYSPHSSIESFYPENESRTSMRHGMGLDQRVFGLRSWIELTNLGGIGRSETAMLSAGVRIPISGGR